MKIIAAIDSFKGSASSEELNAAFFQKINHSQIEAVNVPIADGGEGTIAAIYAACGGEFCTATVSDPLGNPREVSYLLTEITGKSTAIIESAEVLGLQLVKVDDATLRQTSSYGLGELVRKVISQDIQQIYLTLGGTGTADGGLGFLGGLGANLAFQHGINPLLTTTTIDLEPALTTIRQVKMYGLVDVDNPYWGEKGFAKVFGPQKGGNPKTLTEFDQKAQEVAKKMNNQYGVDLRTLAGAGAAGGLGGALGAVGGELVSGFSTVSELISFENQLREADLIITGEGRIDSQTEGGKVPLGVARIAQKYGVPVIAICGGRTNEIGALEQLTLGSFSIQQGPISLKEAMEKEQTLKNVATFGKSIVQVFVKQAVDGL